MCNKKDVKILFLKDGIYLFLERREGKEKERKETSMCGCLPRPSYWGPGPQPWLGMEPATVWFAGRHSIH